MGTPAKDYSVYCGHKYNMLTVLGVKPREFDAKGRYKPARLIVRCDCGRVYDAEAAAVIHGRQKGCICQRGRKDYREPNPLAPEDFPTSREPNIVERLKPKWECTCNFESGCSINELCGICCWECDRPCKMCQNSPEKCGAKKRRQRKWQEKSRLPKSR